MLLMRGDEGVELRTPGEDRLESVNPDADPAGETPEASEEHGVAGHP
jgi:hypothetical protein